jgi:hypothetical protein
MSMRSLLRLGVRRRLARLGIAAMLFQAVLFGWHHHDLTLPQSSAGSEIVSRAAGGSPSPVTAEDDCDICAALHHLTAAPPVTPVGLPPPPAGAAALPRPDQALPRRLPDLAFRARAPPRA